MGKEINIEPLEGLLFDSTKIEPIRIETNSVKSDIYEDLDKTNTLFFYCLELGSTLVFYHKGRFIDDNLLELPISDIISTEVNNEKKRIGKKWFLTIKTVKGIIIIHAGEEEVNTVKRILDTQKEKQILSNETKKITFTSADSTKTLTICPYSPAAQDGEESIFSLTDDEEGFLITNYRAFQNNFYYTTDTKSLTHAEYEDVIASNVEKQREEDIVGGTDSHPSLMTSFLSGMGKAHYYNVSYNEDHHHASSTESEIGDIVFMNDGKQVMIWEDFPDPHSIVKLINSAKAHFSTTPTTPSPSGGEDPIKALKLRFAKGEITKEEFLEMKSMLE